MEKGEKWQVGGREGGRECHQIGVRTVGIQ